MSGIHGITYKSVPVLTQRRRSDFIHFFLRWSWVLLTIVAIIQLLFYDVPGNALAVSIIVLSWLLFTIFFSNEKNIWNFPLSTFLILGFTATQLYLPLLFTTIELKPVVYNLEMPDKVFMHSIATLLVLLVAHALYRLIFNDFTNSARRILAKVDLFRPPSDLQVWTMGLVGAMAMVYLIFIVKYEEGVDPGTGVKFVHAFALFVYAPLFLPFKKLFSNTSELSKNQTYLLALYALLLILLGLGANSRGTFMKGLTAFGFSFALASFMGVVKPKLLSFRFLFVSLSIVWLMTGPLMDLGTAMVLVRTYRKEIPRDQLISLTLEAYKNKEAIRLYRKMASEETGEWDEYYLDNIFLARFCNLKFNDAGLVSQSKINEVDDDMRKFSIDRFWATIPGPFLRIMQIDVDKETVTSFSFGDYLFYKAGGGYNALGGRRVGGFAGTGMAAFGWWYLVILFFLIILAYFAFDILFVHVDTLDNGVAGRGVRFSFLSMLMLTTIWRFVPGESVIDIANFLLRGWLESVVLYVLLFFSINKIVR